MMESVAFHCWRVINLSSVLEILESYWNLVCGKRNAPRIISQELIVILKRTVCGECTDSSKPRYSVSQYKAIYLKGRRIEIYSYDGAPLLDTKLCIDAKFTFPVSHANSKQDFTYVT